MKKKVVYLALQRQLENFLRDRRVASAVIHRVGEGEWLPLIDARTDAGDIQTFSIRLKTSEEPSVWSYLRTLVDWIDVRLCLDECLLSLTALEWELETLAVEQPPE